MIWDGTVCSSAPFCLQRQQQLPNYCCKTRTSTTQFLTWSKSHVLEKYSKKGKYSSSYLKCYTFNKQNIRVSSHETIEFQPTILDGRGTVVLLKDFVQHLKHKDIAIPDIYFTLLEAVSITADLVISSHANAKERREKILFKIATTKVEKILNASVCSPWLAAHFGKSS